MSFATRWAYPHIYATTTHDLFFAEGFVHAQDRFWQMDFWRHIGSGTLSEMFGEGQVDTDAFLRTLAGDRSPSRNGNGLSAEFPGHPKRLLRWRERLP